jgi:hypothetical protein
MVAAELGEARQKLGPGKDGHTATFLNHGDEGSSAVDSEHGNGTVARIPAEPSRTHECRAE